MLEPEEIVASILEAAKGKSNRGSVKRTLANLDASAESLRNDLLSGKWHPRVHDTTTIQEGSHRKKREIVKPSWKYEQIVHHMLARQLANIYGKRIYHYSAGTVKNPGDKKGKGPLFCMKSIVRWRDEYKGKKFYVAELDIAKFFDSVDTEILKKKLSKKIRDKRFLSVLFDVIDAASPGIPKGFYTSPWLAQIYLADLDNYVVQQLKPDHYLRFVDNFFILHKNKKELHKILSCIEEYMDKELHLHFNSSKQIYRFERICKDGKIRGRFINCLGYAIHINRVTMRKTILKRARAKALRIHRQHRCTAHDAATMLSYTGWFRQTDTYNYFLKWIKPNVSVRSCKRKVSAKAKKEAKRRYERMVRNARQQTRATTDTGHNVQPNDGL